MDKKWRPPQRDGSKPYKKSWGRTSAPRFRPGGLVDYANTAGEELAEYVLGVLARDVNALQVTRVGQEGHVTVRAACHPGLTGRLIGKGGKTISALRLLVRAIANEHGKRVDVEVSSAGEEPA